MTTCMLKNVQKIGNINFIMFAFETLPSNYIYSSLNQTDINLSYFNY